MEHDMGGGLPVIGFYEMKQEIYNIARRLKGIDSVKQKRLDFCKTYIPVLKMIEDDEDLKQACMKYSIYSHEVKHQSVINYLEEHFMQDAYDADMVIHDYSAVLNAIDLFERVAQLKKRDLDSLSAYQILGCIAWHFRRDHFNNGSLISESIGKGYMLNMLEAYLNHQTV